MSAPVDPGTCGGGACPGGGGGLLVRGVFALILLAAALAGCNDGPTGPTPGPGDVDSGVATLTFVSGMDQTLLAGRRSPEPFRVLARDAAGRPVARAEVSFRLEGLEATLSQPRALTDTSGVAETWVMDAGPGPARLTARAGAGAVEVPLVVARAPRELRFAPASGAVGLPGLPHPDSVVAVRVLDTEGLPLEGAEVWFAGPPEMSRYVDTTGADGWASTVVRRSEMEAGEGWVWAFMLGFSELIVRTPRPVAAATRRVVLVSVDGLRGDALERWAPPTLLRLASEGASTTRATTVVPSLSTPAHLSLFSGVSPATHGVYGEELEFTPEMTSLEPIFRYAEDHGRQSRAFMAAASALAGFREAFQCRAAFGLDSLTLVDAGGPGVAAAAAPALADPDVEFVFVHVPDPDLAGHAEGWGSEAYGRAVLRADSAVSDIVEVLSAGTLLIVTSDHGGGGAYGSRQHGSTSEADTRIPLILRGPAVVPGTRLGEVSILDVAPTALWAVGIRAPLDYEGRALLDAFGGE